MSKIYFIGKQLRKSGNKNNVAENNFFNIKIVKTNEYQRFVLDTHRKFIKV